MNGFSHLININFAALFMSQLDKNFYYLWHLSKDANVTNKIRHVSDYNVMCELFVIMMKTKNRIK